MANFKWPKVSWQIWLVPVLIIILGTLRALVTYNLAFGFGDQSTFFMFARSLVRGESIYKDFIHFRTPGFYFFSAVFLKLFGVKLSIQMLAGAIESYVLYPLIFYCCALKILRKRTLAAIGALICVGMPGILQLRTGLGLLAVTLYAAADAAKLRSRHYLWLVGAALGLSFIFGQEVAIFAAFCIGLAEIASYYAKPKLLFSRLGHMALGALAALVPLLIYIIGWSNLRNFFYYVFPYAFILQPKGMNVPFPPLDHAHLIFYLPFAIYLISFANFYLTKRLNRTNVVLLSFGAVRLISALGRADVAHLLFAIPELFIIFPLSLAGIDQLSLTRRQLLQLVPLALGLAIIFALSIKVMSSFMLLAPLLFIAAKFGPAEASDAVASPVQKRQYFAAAMAAVAVFAFLLIPIGMSGLRGFAHGLRPSTLAKISGVRVTPQEQLEIESVKNAIETYRPRVLFSFPIQPYYYSLVPKHATRFLTYEFQTTNEEQSESIADLEQSRPQLVIFDMLQAEGLSGGVYRISDYLTSNFRTVGSKSLIEYLKYMIPKDHPSLEQHLAFHLYELNSDRTGLDGYHIDNHDGTITDALIQRGGPSNFRLGIKRHATLQTGVTAEPGSSGDLNRCGQLEIKSSTATVDRKLCSADGIQSIDLSAFVDQPATITFNRVSPETLIWLDPVITASSVVAVR